MSRFQFRLQAVLQIRRLERDHRQIQLAQAREDQRLLAVQAIEILHDLEEVKHQARRSAQPGEIIVDELSEARRYESQLDVQLNAIRQREVLIQEEVASRHQRLVHANREVMMLEKLRDRQLEEYWRNQSRLENMIRDESAAHSSFRQENTS